MDDPIDQDLEQWSALWQSHDEPVTELRERFARQHRRASFNYWGQQITTALSMVAVLACIIHLFIQDRALLIAFSALLYLPMGAFIIHRNRHFWIQRRITMPLSPQGHIKSMLHNLDVETRELRLGQRFLCWALVYVIGIFTLELIEVGPKPYMITTIIGVLLFYASVMYHTFYIAPHKLRTRRQELHDIAQSLSIDIQKL